MTVGYGPERFLLERAEAGSYRVQVRYYRSDQRRTSLRTYVLATIHEDRGRPGETTERRVLALGVDGQFTEVGTVKRARAEPRR